MATPPAPKVWTPKEITDAVAGSGKPLEVTAAQAFLRGAWAPRLGTYFDERNTMKPPRELDVLATKASFGSGQCNTTIHWQVQGLVSCKGFTATQEPVGFSMRTSNLATLTPSVLSHHRARQDGNPNETYGRLVDVETGAAARLLSSLGLTGGPQLVALSVVDDKREKKLVGDHELFEGVDSALKAAFYWQAIETYGYSVGVFVPVLVLLRPWWEVPIDGGVIGTPTQSRRGYMTCRYPNPHYGPPREPTVDVTTLIVTSDQLDDLVGAFEDLFKWLEWGVIAWFGEGASLRQ